jgi:protein-disulfide isomerase
MTHDEIVAALQHGYQLDDARESRRGCYPIRKSAPRATGGRLRDDPPPFGTSDPTDSATAPSSDAMTGRRQADGDRAARARVAPVDTVDHARGDPLGPVIIEYGDYECPYARAAFREIERVQRRTGNAVRFVFRHFPLTELHPHALAAAAAAEAAALQDQFWTMHALLFHRQNALADDHLRRYAAKLGLDVVRFDRDRTGPAVLERVRRDVRSGSATGQVTGTPTLFIDGVVHRGSYKSAALLEVLAPRLQQS